MEYETIINDYLDEIDLSGLSNLSENPDITMYLPDGVSVENIIHKLMNGQPILDSDSIFNNLKELFFLEIKGAAVLGCEILIVCIITGMLTNLADSFGGKPVSSLSTLICSCIITGLCIGNFYQTYDYCCNSMDMMTSTMEILLPILIPLLLSMGAISSGTIMNPLILGAVTGFNVIMKHIILPMIFLSAVFVLINSLAERDYIKKLAVLLRRVAIFITGFSITIFTGITAIQGIVTKSADGILMNTARFSIDNFIPIVGGFAADSLDMFISCVGLIKNSIGLIGIIAVISLITVPVIKLIAIAAVYKLTAIITEPISTKQISESINEIGSSAITMTVVLGVSAFMFLIFITVLMSIGGGTTWR